MQLPLSDRTVEVWVVDLLVQDHELARANDLLSPDEARRADRFRYPADRRKFVVSRGSLRRILGGYLSAAPEQAVFEYGEYGKPRLSAPPIDIRFNLSRSGDKALIACTVGHEIGVDIEWANRDIEFNELASRFFTGNENAALQKYPADQRKQAFLKCWTLKEAFVKAVGKGLSLGLDAFDVSPGLGDPGGRSEVERFVVNGWSLVPFTANGLDNYVSALATQGEATVIVKDWLNQD